MPEDHPDYFTFIIGKRYLKVVVMEWKDDAQYGRINAAPATVSVHALLIKTQVLFSKPPLGTPPLTRRKI